jgi:TolB protein
MVKTEDGSRLVERDMASGRTRTVYSSRTLVVTPTYAPDGNRIAFGLDAGSGLEIHEYDLAQGCCLKRLTRTRSADNLSATFAPDGRRIAFHSNRTGRQHIYVMDADGSAQTILSPLGTSVEYAAPDWSPTGNEVVFHGASRGTFQLMLADASRPGAQIQQLTSVGRNEDPSWAPDGRHIVFTGVAAGAIGLYVIDTKTGQVRRLASGALRLAEWSPSLAGTIDLVQ